MKKSSLPISVQLERHERLPKPLLRLLTRIFTKSAPKCPTRPRTLTGWILVHGHLWKKAGAPLPELLDHNAAPASYDVIFWVSRFGGMKLQKSSRVSSRRTISAIRKSSYFATSGGSGFGKTLEKLKPAAGPHADLMEGRILNGRVGEGTLKKLLAASV